MMTIVQREAWRERAIWIAIVAIIVCDPMAVAIDRGLDRARWWTRHLTDIVTRDVVNLGYHVRDAVRVRLRRWRR